MAEIGVRDLKARASEIIRAVREQHARYVITYRGRPVGVLLPLGEPSGETSVDIESGQAAWEELVRLGEAIGREWQSPLTSVELLSEMRR
jgi:prevent-host-death family protein